MNNHQSGAELQTMREASLITREALAQACGVEVRTVKHWETRKGFGVPSDVWGELASLIEWINAATRFALDSAKQEPGASVVLLRYRDSKDMTANDQAHGLRADMHGAAVAHVFRALIHQGKDPRVVWFDPESFAQWLSTSGAQGEPESAQRAAWAAQHGIQEQARPHRGDQPHF